MADTAFAQAFEKAGATFPSERLRVIAIEALIASPGNWDGAKDALFRGIRDDAALLWALFAPYRAKAAHDLLTDVAVEARQQEMPRREQGRGSGAGQALVDNQIEGARPAPTKSGMDAPVTRPPATRPTAAPSAGQVRASMEHVADLTRRSLLDSFTLNGQSIGDLTPREAVGWAKSRERDARFVRLLTENLPSDMPIRRFRTADEAAACYVQAETGADDDK